MSRRQADGVRHLAMGSRGPEQGGRSSGPSRGAPPGTLGEPRAQGRRQASSSSGSGAGAAPELRRLRTQDSALGGRAHLHPLPGGGREPASVPPFGKMQKRAEVHNYQSRSRRVFLPASRTRPGTPASVLSSGDIGGRDGKGGGRRPARGIEGRLSFAPKGSGEGEESG